MIEYPKVKHKIPELFELIIKNDRVYEEAKEQGNFQLFKEAKQRKAELLNGAEKFIIRQKGGTT